MVLVLLLPLLKETSKDFFLEIFEFFLIILTYPYLNVIILRKKKNINGKRIKDQFKHLISKVDFFKNLNNNVTLSKGKKH